MLVPGVYIDAGNYLKYQELPLVFRKKKKKTKENISALRVSLEIASYVHKFVLMFFNDALFLFFLYANVYAIEKKFKCI